MPLLGTPALTLAINAGTTTNGNALVTSPTDNTLLSAACEVQGAKKFLNLYFQLPGTGTGAAPINQQLPSGFALAVNGKPNDDLQATTVLFTASGFAEKQDGTNAYYYQAFLNLDTDEIGTAFASGDADLLEALVDIDLDLPAAGSVPALQATFQVALNLLRQVYAGTESAPTPATPVYPPGAQVTAMVAAYLAGTLGGGDFAPAITSVGNGASTSLEAMSTIGLIAPVLRTLAIGNELQNWLLVAGTDATDTDANGNPAHQRPNDFNAATNAQVWVRR